MKIPKIFHQIWFDFGEGNGSEYPEKLKSYRDSWINLHPDWQYKLWNEEEFLKILPENLYELYYSYNKMIKKVDFAKFVILYMNGGVYVDCDDECFKNIEPALGEYDVVLTFDYHIEQFSPGMAIINSFMASVPKHPLFAFLINKCPAHKDKYVCKATGPTFLGGMIYEYYDDKNNDTRNVKIYMNDDYKLFYPVSWADKADNIIKYRHNREEFIKKYPDAYRTSHWSGLWDGNNIANF